MYKDLVYALTVIYKHLANAGTQISREQVEDIRKGAKSLTDTAPMAIVRTENAGPADAEELNRARLIEEHITAMSVYLMNQEIM